MKEVFKCRDWKMMRWVEEWTKAQAWGCPCRPKKYPRSTSVKAWGCPRGTPSSAKIRSPFKTLYFYCFMHYAFFLESQLFLVFSLFSFVCCNKWLDPNKLLLEKLPCFSFAKNTPLSIAWSSVLLFLELCLAFDFRLDLCSDLVISFHQGVFWPLVHVGFHQKSCL
jgi:hypothetical protein